jgi:heat-inducible transcriptional repressor
MFDNAMYNRSIQEISQVLGKEAMKPRIRQMVDFHDDILNFLIKAFSRFQDKERYSSGLTRIFNQPEFYDHESMQGLLEMIDNDTWTRLLNDLGHGLTVHIGDEIGIPNMKNCSVISIPFQISDNASGVICVIGPIRMQYKKVFPILEYVSNCLTKLYNDKEK